MRNLYKSLISCSLLMLLAAGCAESQHYLGGTRKFINENVRFTTEDPLDPGAPSYWTDYMSQQGGG